MQNHRDTVVCSTTRGVWVSIHNTIKPLFFHVKMITDNSVVKNVQNHCAFLQMLY